MKFMELATTESRSHGCIPKLDDNFFFTFIWGVTSVKMYNSNNENKGRQIRELEIKVTNHTERAVQHLCNLKNRFQSLNAARNYFRCDFNDSHFYPFIIFNFCDVLILSIPT